MKQKLKYAYSYYFSALVQNIPDKNKYCAGTLVLDRQKIVCEEANLLWFLENYV